jgi:hypothetical protein
MISAPCQINVAIAIITPCFIAVEIAIMSMHEAACHPFRAGF